MARVTGIGGVFFKSRTEATELTAWYQAHLGIPLESFGGAILKWSEDTAEDGGMTVWHVADPDSEWFRPSDAPFMINYRVDDLDGMIAQLQADGVEVVGDPQSDENGKFAWIMDPDGNKVELWQPMVRDAKNKGA
jgi:predicted enzyme related to lactoylglutathione lyase